MNRAQVRIAASAFMVFPLMPASIAAADDLDAHSSKIIVGGADSASPKDFKVAPKNPCATEACVKAGDGQSATGPDLQPEPKDITLQYPGHDPPSVSPKDVLEAFAEAKEASGNLVNKAGPLAKEAIDDLGEGAAKIVVPAELFAAGRKGFEEGGVPGAAAGVAKEGIKQAAGAATTAVVTSTCGPVAGVVAGICAEAATEQLINFGEKNAPLPGDASVNCAKVGNCGSSNPTVNFSKVLQDSHVSGSSNPTVNFSRVLQDSGVSGSSNPSVNIGNLLMEAGVTGPVDTRDIDSAKLQAAIGASNQAAQAREAYARQQAELARMQAQTLAAEEQAESEQAQEQKEEARSDEEARARSRERRRGRQRERVEAQRAVWQSQWNQAVATQQAWWAAQQQAAAAWLQASPSYQASGSFQSGSCGLPAVPNTWSSLQDLHDKLDAGTRDFNSCLKSRQSAAAAPASYPVAGGDNLSGWSSAPNLSPPSPSPSAAPSSSAAAK